MTTKLIHPKQSLDGTRSEIKRKDLLVKVFDPRVFKLGDFDDPWVTVLAIGETKTLEKDAIYQALAYACKEGLVNLHKERVAPIFVMQWAFNRWSYAVLDFKKQQKSRWMHLHRKGDVELRFYKDDIQKKLSCREEYHGRIMGALVPPKRQNSSRISYDNCKDRTYQPNLPHRIWQRNTSKETLWKLDFCGSRCGRSPLG
ncbi:hypothetical protein SELMODRAFT_423202 [Selaginella moellendorffii]|uniref:Uncharacterized protein n=1 Tax=Selaginella moellendorffii TaxID=88036 RepID=D8SKW9_SELML|nr:hypothetical protein SELMODRAFT_423202 [Selaginella moellendorffii]